MGIFDFLKRTKASTSASGPLRSAVTQPALTPEQQFAILAIRELEHAEGIERVLPVAQDFALLVSREGEDQPATLYLANIFRETRDMSPEDRQQALNQFLKVMHRAYGAEKPSWDIARERLLPTPRPSNMLIRQTSALPVVHRPFAPCLSEVLVLDDEQSMQFVTGRELEAWGVDAPTAFAAAHERLASMAHALEPYAGEKDGVWSLANHDAYDASRALSIGFLDGASEGLGGRIAFALPHRDLLVLCLADNLSALQQLQEITKREFDAAPRNISSEIYVCSNGRVEPLTLAAEHPMAATLALARIQFRGGEYNEQKVALESALEKQGDPVFVASFSAVDHEALGPVSYCVWGQDVDSLLPITDIVYLAGALDGEKWTICVRWDDLVGIAGSSLQAADLPGPARYRTLLWPSPTVLDALREVSAL